MRTLRMDSTQTSQFLTPLFNHAKGFIEHRWMFPGGAILSEFFRSENILFQAMSTWPVKAHHYFGVATRKDSSSGKKVNLANLVCCHADVDYGPNKDYKTREDALAAIEAFPLRTSAVVDTGNGFHCYWFFLDPLPAPNNLAQVEAVNKGIAQELNGDSVGDASRVLRIPGTYNVKEPINFKLVTFLWCEPDRRYVLEDFAKYASPISEKENPRVAPRPVSYGDIGGSAYGRAALAGELAKLTQIAPGGRNNALNKAAFSLGKLVAVGHLDEDTVMSLLATVALTTGLPQREIESTLRSRMSAGAGRTCHV
jgi:hypothetical protein